MLMKRNYFGVRSKFSNVKIISALNSAGVNLGFLFVTILDNVYRIMSGENAILLLFFYNSRPLDLTRFVFQFLLN